MSWITLSGVLSSPHSWGRLQKRRHKDNCRRDKRVSSWAMTLAFMSFFQKLCMLWTKNLFLTLAYLFPWPRLQLLHTYSGFLSFRLVTVTRLQGFKQPLTGYRSISRLRRPGSRLLCSLSWKFRSCNSPFVENIIKYHLFGSYIRLLCIWNGPLLVSQAMNIKNVIKSRSLTLFIMNKNPKSKLILQN